jgi:hypothetical protein
MGAAARRHRKVRAAVEAVPPPVIHGIQAWDYVNERPYCGVDPECVDVKYHRSIQESRVTCPNCKANASPRCTLGPYGTHYICPRGGCGGSIYAQWPNPRGGEIVTRTVRHRGQSWRDDGHPATVIPAVARAAEPTLYCNVCRGKVRLPDGLTLEHPTHGVWGRSR